MRVWHKDLIPVLPGYQLIGQWRDCCLIARNLRTTGLPGHPLVNRVLDHPVVHFVMYCRLVSQELARRGYAHNWDNFSRWEARAKAPLPEELTPADLFPGWHNDRYLLQCLCMLQELHDAGVIASAEWAKIEEKGGEKWKALTER